MQKHQFEKTIKDDNGVGHMTLSIQDYEDIKSPLFVGDICSLVFELKVINPEIPTAPPTCAESGAAGMDLRAYLKDSVTILPNRPAKLIRTNIAIWIDDPNIGGFIYPRSGLAGKLGITLANCVGVIDSSYQGEIMLAVINLGMKDFTIKPGERIAQIVFQPIIRPIFKVVEKFSGETERGVGGFGSTGVK